MRSNNLPPWDLNRVVSAKEVAEFAFFLGASAGAKSMTGGAFPVDAGISL
jgi:enoyl-[acyl-carrier-protein] reductase (NADH)